MYNKRILKTTMNSAPQPLHTESKNIIVVFYNIAGVEPSTCVDNSN